MCVMNWTKKHSNFGANLQVAGNNFKPLSLWHLQLISIVLNLRGQILRDCKPSDLDDSFISMHCAECLPGFNEQWACETESVRAQLFQRKFSDYLFILDPFLKWGEKYCHWDFVFENGFVKYRRYLESQLLWSHIWNRAKLELIKWIVWEIIWWHCWIVPLSVMILLSHKICMYACSFQEGYWL